MYFCQTAVTAVHEHIFPSWRIENFTAMTELLKVLSRGTRDTYKSEAKRLKSRSLERRSSKTCPVLSNVNRQIYFAIKDYRILSIDAGTITLVDSIDDGSFHPIGRITAYSWSLGGYFF